MERPGNFSVRPVTGLPEIVAGFDLAAAITGLVDPEGGDIIAISQKVVSKAEGRSVALADVTPGKNAERLAAELDKDPKLVELILSEATSVVRADGERGILITETRHGFICANSGIDSSNVVGEDTVLLLPEDPDASARQIRADIESASGQRPAVLITDSFGRAWRTGQSEVAIGCAGLVVVDDWRGREDGEGRTLTATMIAIADQVAAAADLARDKNSRTPVVIVTGLDRYVTEADGPGCLSQLRKREEDLFR